jgi:hypothetical protein
VEDGPLVVAWLASGYFCMTPLFRPRGIYGWGHYGMRHLYIGVPLLVITLVCSILAWPPTGVELCRSRGIKLLIMLVAIKVRVLAPWIVFNGEGERDQFLPEGNDMDERDFEHAVSDAS